jgi:hypothetical protein
MGLEKPLFELKNPGLISIPLGFLGVIFGSLLMRDRRAEDMWNEVYARQNTGLLVSKSVLPRTWNVTYRSISFYPWFIHVRPTQTNCFRASGTSSRSSNPSKLPNLVYPTKSSYSTFDANTSPATITGGVNHEP